MKQFKFYWMALVAMFAWSFTSCSDDDTPGLEPEPEETVEKYFDIYDAMTYDQYMDDDYSTAAIDLDSNNCFEIEVMERDYYGEYGCQFFDAYDYDVQEMVFMKMVSGNFG